MFQQATGGFLAFAQLAKLASIFNLSIVEPYVSGTRINGVPRFIGKQPPKDTMTLSTFYDMTSLQSTLKSCCYASHFVNFTTMMMKASRNIIYVCFIPKKGHYNFGPKKIMEINRDNVNAYDRSLFKRLKMWVSHISKGLVTPFQLLRIFVVDARPTRPLYLSNITDALSDVIREEVSKNGPATVVFSGWRGLYTESSNFFYYIPDFPRCDVYLVNHSKVILEATKQFAKSLSQIRPVIGVHIRGERLIRTSGGSSYYLECLRELKNRLHSLVKSTNAAHDSVHIFHDLGPYGSVSCQNNHTCRQEKPRFLSKIKELGFPVVYYDPTRFDVDSVHVNAAFASFVEREYLTSQVDVLVTVGRGSYQWSIVERFVG